jgi:hypothetical protein
MAEAQLTIDSVVHLQPEKADHVARLMEHLEIYDPAWIEVMNALYAIGNDTDAIISIRSA